jgi:hypothetical protein
MSLKIRMNKAAADLLTAHIVAGLKRVGDVADSVSRAANDATKAADASGKVRPAMRSWSAAAFADLLDRVFHR